MTNITYFRTVIRDAYSTSSSSSHRSSQTSQRHTVEAQPKSTVKQRVKAFRVTSILGFKQKVVRDERKEVAHPHFYSSDSENFSFEETEIGENLLDGKKLDNPSVYYSEFKIFSFEELKTATGNPLNEYSLGVDDCDREFKGWIHEKDLTAAEPGNGIAIVVKLLDRGKFVLRKDEERYLGRLSHPNLVKLFGCYNEHPLYVFEFMPRTLEDHLFERARLLLPWSLRMKVALGVAKGLGFLHKAQVIYREFSASNIHLDINYNAKLSDFGLPKDCLPGDKSRSAPEYCVTGHQTAKLDVYSFGILLLEIISGQQSSKFEEQDKASSTSPKQYNKLAGEFVEEQGIVKWARYHLDTEISHIVDDRLKGQYSIKNAQKVANLAFKCLATEATMRPNMDRVVEELKQLQDSKYMKFIKCTHNSLGYEELKIEFEESLAVQDTRRRQYEELKTEFEEVPITQNMDIIYEDWEMGSEMGNDEDSFLSDGR